LREESRFEEGEVFADAVEDLLAEGVTLGEEDGKRCLRGCAEGRKSVRDDFETIEGGMDLRGRAPGIEKRHDDYNSLGNEFRL